MKNFPLSLILVMFLIACTLQANYSAKTKSARVDTAASLH